MGMLFPSVEHAYQFVKARFHGRPDLCQQILKATTPGAAKRLTKQIRVTNDWSDQRQFLMAELLELKFRSCPPFQQTLLSSDDFIDHTVPDTYWGTGIDKRDPGQNVFGLLLARLRNRHHIPDDKTRVVVLGHSFISHLKTRIDDDDEFLLKTQKNIQVSSIPFSSACQVRPSKCCPIMSGLPIC